MIFQVSFYHQAFALSSPKQMKNTDIKRGLLIQGTSTSIFQKRIKNLLDLSPDLKPSYGIASPLKYTNIQKKPSKIMFMNLCYLFYKLRPFTLKHLLHSKRIRKNLVGAEQAFSLYLGHRLFFNLNQISTYFVTSSL